MGKWGGGVKNFTLNGEMGGVKDFTLNGEMGGGGVKDFTLNGEMGGRPPNFRSFQR